MQISHFSRRSVPASRRRTEARDPIPSEKLDASARGQTANRKQEIGAEWRRRERETDAFKLTSDRSKRRRAFRIEGISEQVERS